MNREEAHDELPKLDSYMQWGMVHDVIDKIYDDFESRVCENCKHFERLQSHKIDCLFFGTIIEENSGLDYSFGCTKWEKK